jgi:hypothetical protein
VLAFVLQHLPEHSPPAVEHGLPKPCPRQLRRAHVANDDILILVNDPAAELVQSIPPPVGYSAVQTLRLAFVATTLRLRKPLLRLAVKPRSL